MKNLCFQLGRDDNPFPSWSIGLFAMAVCFLVFTGSVCEKEVKAPTGAVVEADGFNVGFALGTPDTWGQISGDVHDPCQYIISGSYPIKKIIIEVFRYDGNQNEQAIYPKVILQDGVNFLSGNPAASVGPGVKFKIPYSGAFKVRTRVYGYPCDELASPSLCLECCGGDNTAGPYWEEVSVWREFKKDNASSYVSYPKFLFCL